MTRSRTPTTHRGMRAEEGTHPEFVVAYERNGRRRLLAPVVALATSVALVSGCGEAGADLPVVAVRDSAGITIADNRFPDSTAVTWWRVETPPLVDIGGAEANESESLFQVGGAVRLADGRIVVSNGGSGEVRWFDAGGRLIRTSGRRGDGPGEFQRPGRIIPLPGDSVIVAETFGLRATVLDPSGEFARDFPVLGAGLSLLGRLDNGTIVGYSTMVLGAAGFTDGMQRPNLAFIGLSPAGELGDTLVAAPGAERFLRLSAGQGQLRSVAISQPPFRKTTTFALDGDEILVATQDGPEILAYSGTDGRLTRIIRTGVETRPVTPEHIEAWISRQVENAPEEQRQEIRESIEALPAGETIPAYGTIETDDLGYLWVADSDDRINPAGAWSVYDPDGRLTARIHLPESIRLFQIGEDFIVGLERDDLDVEHLRVYRLIRG